MADARLVCRLRAADVPIEEIRSALGSDEASIRRVLESHSDRLATEARALRRKTAALEEFLETGITMPAPSTSRPVQITIHADDVQKAARFYTEVFDLEYLEDISSLSFGAYGTDAFFLLTIDPQANRTPSIRAGTRASGSSSTISTQRTSGRSRPGPPKCIRRATSNGNRARRWSTTRTATGSP